MKTINQILEDVLEKEGWPAYTEHPNDRGGPTKGGITLRSLESFRGRRCTRRQLQALKQEEAVALLERRYVNQNGIYLLVATPVGPQLVDNAVLSGPVLSVKDFQRALKARLAIDGIIGKRTVAAYEKEDPRRIGHRVAVRRALRLCRHVQKNPDQVVFLSGWIKRCLSFIEEEE